MWVIRHSGFFCDGMVQNGTPKHILERKENCKYSLYSTDKNATEFAFWTILLHKTNHDWTCNVTLCQDLIVGLETSNNNNRKQIRNTQKEVVLYKQNSITKDVVDPESIYRFQGRLKRLRKSAEGQTALVRLRKFPILKKVKAEKVLGENITITCPLLHS